MVPMRCLRLSWSVKYFCQKYWVKGSKSRTSAGTPRISRRPVQRWRWGRVLRTILFKNHQFLRQNAVFLVLKWFQVDLGSSSKKRQIFKISSKFWHFFRHISWPDQVFPWSNWAHIKAAQSSNIVLKHCLRIYWFIKYFSKKHCVKEQKNHTSAGSPRISRRPVQWRR